MKECCDVKTIEKNDKEDVFLEGVLAYQPLFLILILSFLMTFAITKFFSLSIFMGFNFVFLSFLKLIDLPGFVDGFKNYDPIAKKVSLYGYVYPFIELMLGLFLLSKINKSTFYLVGAAVLLTTGVGVIIEKFVNKRSFACACMGSKINVPLGAVSLFENLFMALMLLFMVFY